MAEGSLKKGNLVRIVDIDPSDEYHFLSDVLIGTKAQITNLPDAHHLKGKPDYRVMRLKLLETKTVDDKWKLPWGFTLLFVSVKVEKDTEETT